MATDASHKSPRTSGRLLWYATEADVVSVAGALRDRPAHGVVIRSRTYQVAVDRIRESGDAREIIVDTGAWASQLATEDVPTAYLTPEEGTLDFGFSVDDWAAPIINAGASAVLTPSRFVRAADWRALHGVLSAGARSVRPDVYTLVPADAAMLEMPNRQKFFAALSTFGAGRPLAFAFAGRAGPFVARDRAFGLRELVAEFPSALIVGVDPLAGFDVYVRGTAVAIGVSGSLRQPRRPGDGGPRAIQGVPGYFLRPLWEYRSPDKYKEWFANSIAPSCELCGGRAATDFDSSPADRAAIAAHNMHATLAVADEIDSAGDAQAWLAADRKRALDEHHIRWPYSSNDLADKLLKALCELDRRRIGRGERARGSHADRSSSRA